MHVAFDSSYSPALVARDVRVVEEQGWPEP
jgi:hypothetical protein